MSSPKEYLVEVCVLAIISNFCLELQRLKTRAKDTVVRDLNPTGDFNLMSVNSLSLLHINPAHGACGIPSNRSIIAYQELGIVVIFDLFQFVDTIRSTHHSPQSAHTGGVEAALAQSN